MAADDVQVTANACLQHGSSVVFYWVHCAFRCVGSPTIIAYHQLGIRRFFNLMILATGYLWSPHKTLLVYLKYYKFFCGGWGVIEKPIVCHFGPIFMFPQSSILAYWLRKSGNFMPLFLFSQVLCCHQKCQRSFFLTPLTPHHRSHSPTGSNSFIFLPAGSSNKWSFCALGTFRVKVWKEQQKNPEK